MADLTRLIRDIRASCPGRTLLENEPLARQCYFRIGGPCAALALPASEEELLDLCRILRQAGQEPLVMGNGTNLLITDAYLPRIALRLGEGLSRAERRAGNVLYAQSGATLSQLAVLAARQRLTGLEFAHGIPGTLGGALVMNAGAYGGEMKDVAVSIRYLDRELIPRETADGGFSYRRSRFSAGGELILGACLELAPGTEEAITGRMRELAERRRASQPLDQPSAGSTFKRPPGAFAAALIQEAGLKGYSVGGAMVSPKHAGFVVNTGGATFRDVLELMEHIQNTVYRVSGVQLEPEVRIVRE